MCCGVVCIQGVAGLSEDLAKRGSQLDDDLKKLVLKSQQSG